MDSLYRASVHTIRAGTVLTIFPLLSGSTVRVLPIPNLLWTRPVFVFGITIFFVGIVFWFLSDEGNI